MDGNFVYKFTIKNVTSNDSGEYKCQIGNSNHQIEQVLYIYYKIEIFNAKVFYNDIHNTYFEF